MFIIYELSSARQHQPRSQVLSEYLKCHQNHSNKPMSGAGSPSCRPGFVEKYKTANMILTAIKAMKDQFAVLYFSHGTLGTRLQLRLQSVAVARRLKRG